MPNLQHGLILNLSILLAASIFVAEPSEAKQGWFHWSAKDGGNDHWYAVVRTRNDVTWKAANARAKRMAPKAHLVTITTAAESAFVYSIVRRRADTWNGWFGPWIGAYQRNTSHEPIGGWSWVTREPWKYSNWFPGEPNNENGNENYAHLFQWCEGTCRPETAATWNDSADRAAREVRGFIVETPVAPPDQ